MSTIVRPGSGVHVTNGSGGNITAGATVKEGNFVGVAVKQKTPSWKDGLSTQKTIASTEPYYLITKGVVEVADPGLSTPAVGDAVYITSAGVITKTGAANTPFGRIVALAGTRGVKTGQVRIDLDIKTAVAAATF